VPFLFLYSVGSYAAASGSYAAASGSYAAASGAFLLGRAISSVTLMRFLITPITLTCITSTFQALTRRNISRTRNRYHLKYTSKKLKGVASYSIV